MAKYEYTILTANNQKLVIGADNRKHLAKIYAGKFAVIKRTVNKVN